MSLGASPAAETTPTAVPPHGSNVDTLDAQPHSVYKSGSVVLDSIVLLEPCLLLNTHPLPNHSQLKPEGHSTFHKSSRCEGRTTHKDGTTRPACRQRAIAVAPFDINCCCL